MFEITSIKELSKDEAKEYLGDEEKATIYAFGFNKFTSTDSVRGGIAEIISNTIKEKTKSLPKLDIKYFSLPDDQISDTLLFKVSGFNDRSQMLFTSKVSEIKGAANNSFKEYEIEPPRKKALIEQVQNSRENGWGFPSNLGINWR